MTRRVLLLTPAFWLSVALTARAASTTWQGGAANLNWSTIGNWFSGVPTATSDVLFFTNGAVLTSASNNVISANTTVQSLRYTHTNSSTGTQTYQNTYINSGVTLTVSNVLATNAVFVGSGLALAGCATTASISGPNGSLAIVATNGVINVRQGGSSDNYRMATLDLSGLSNCTIRAQRVLVAGDGSNGSAERDRQAGTLKLARNSTLYLSSGSFPPALTVGYTIGNGSGITSNLLVLGQTNYIYSDTGLAVGMGRNPSLMKFGGFANSWAKFRDTAGTGRQSRWLIGDSSPLTYWGSYSAGTNDFSGGVVDAQVALVVVGRSVNGTANPAGGGNDGALLLDGGTLDANTLVVGYQLNDYCARVGGYVYVDGTAHVQVNNAIQLGRFLGSAASNGVSSAILNIGTLTGGGTVTVNGSITTTTSTKNTNNNSQVLVRNGGSLSVKGTIGPLSNFELNNCTLGLDFGTGGNPTSAVCSTTNLATGAPVTLNIAGTGLTPGQIALIKYKNAPTGSGFGGFTTLTLPDQTQGYLSNNTANSSIDLVITQSSPVTNVPPLLTPRLSGQPPVYADYGAPLTEASARADGYIHVDTPALVAKLVAGNIKTYAFLIWQRSGNYKTDWDDFRLEFLPAAQAAGINVWLYLTPPSENSPPAAYTPFAEDYYSWLTEPAQLSLRYPVLKGVVIDDFNGNVTLFTPAYVSRIAQAAQVINPGFMFMVINYDLSHGWASYTGLITPAFMNNYGPYLGGVILPYLNWGLNGGNWSTNYYNDYSGAATNIAINSDIVSGKMAQLVMRTSVAPSAGDYGAASLVITNDSGTFPDAPCPFYFRVSNYPTNPVNGSLVFELRVDGVLAWSMDQASFYGVVDTNIDLQTWVRGKASVTVMVREYANSAALRAVGCSWNLRAGDWARTETGAFVGKTTYYPATPNGVPMVVMIYDGGYSNPTWHPSTNWVHDVNVIAQAAVQAGQAVGIIQYSMDKSPSSPQFPIIQQLYGQWAYQPRFTSLTHQADGSALVRGTGGGPNIGYTLRAADGLGTPPDSWTAVTTGAFGPWGAFTNTDNTAPGHSGRFYRISVP
jgi:hypothetical protein